MYDSIVRDKISSTYYWCYACVVGSLFDLSYPFTGKSILITDFFKCHFRLIDTEKGFNDVSFAFVQHIQGTRNFSTERLHHQFIVSHRRIRIGQDIQKTVIFTFNKRSIYGNVLLGAFIASTILSSGKSTLSAISSTLGRRSFSCSNLFRMRLILLTDPT